MSRKKSNGIRQTDPPKTPKVWEKARREKMKIYFNELQEVLPLYDPSAPMSRFEILQKSRMYIKELQSQNQDLLNGGFDEVFKNKMEKLKQRVKELLQRVDQLTDLLRRANIMIPPLVPCPGKQENTCFSQKWMNQRPKKWTEKINVIVPDEKIENILSLIKNFKKKNSKISVGKKNCKSYENLNEKQVQNGSLVKNDTFSESVELKKKKQLRKIKTSKVIVSDASSSKNDKNGSDSFTDSPSHTKENQPVDFNLPVSDESPVKVSECNNMDKTNQNKSGSVEKIHVQSKIDTNITDGDEKSNEVTEKVKNAIEPQNNVFLPVSNSVMQSNTYLLTNDGNLVHFPILNSSGNMFGSNSNLLTQTAIVNQPNSGLLTPLVINRPSPVIVLQKPGPQLIQATQIVNPTPQILSVPNPNIQILSNSVVCATSSQNSNSKTMPYILSKQPANKKRLAKDSTMTTYVNKIPIPALSKQSYVKKGISVNNCIGTKGKTFCQYKAKDGKEKSTEGEKSNANESESEVSVNEKEIQTDKCTETCAQESDAAKEKEKEMEKTARGAESSAQKRSIADEEVAGGKKQKVIGENAEDNFFKPIIENPIVANPPSSGDSLFCNLKLPNSVTHNLSVSPTAAFLSTFPIVAASKFEVEDEIAAKIIERRPCEDKSVGLCGEKEAKRKGIAAEPPENVQDSHAKNCDLSEVAKAILPSEESPDSSKFASEEKIINSNSSPVGKSTSDISAVNPSLNISIGRNSINNGSATAVTTANNNNNNNNSNNNNSNNNNNNNSSSNNNSNNSNSNMAKESSKTCSNTSSCSNNINNNNGHCSKSSNNTSNNNNNDNNNNIAVSDTLCSQLVDVNKSWHDYNHSKNCDIRTDPFYIHSDIVNSVPSPAITNVLTNTMASFADTSAHNSAIYKSSYSQNNMKTNFDDQNAMNEQITLKGNQFDYAQKENFINKRMVYNGERQMMKKMCTNSLANDGYSLPKNPSDMYQTDSSIGYQLMPAKEISNQRNSRPPVNWMTDPDVRSRSMSYGSQAEKMPSAKIPPFNQADIFCMNNQSGKPQSEVAADYVLGDMNKMTYQKNEYCMGKSLDPQMKQPADQRCKNVDKRSETKFPAKPTQNSYNIFDYNYNGNYFGDDETNKFCSLQSFPCNAAKSKKGNSNLGVTKKKADATMHVVAGDQHPIESIKRNSDHLSNMDFNSVGNQECFSWVPGKNVDWLPGKSFVDNNLILPSTLPTLVGDLALGTTTSSDVAQTKGNGRANQGKTGLESGGKSYMDLGLCNNAPFPKPPDTASEKQYLEPFTNLSKNIFDLTPSGNVQNSQVPKGDCEKSGYAVNANETIVLKNIFELPVSKGFGNDFASRSKQRSVNNTQNTFLSVSQLVETPNYESNAIKAEAPMESGVGKGSDSYVQNYTGYHGSQKSYKNKNRNQHYKYNERKYLGYKHGSSNYTAEALIRSNANLSYQSNEFQPEVNSNFYNVKNPQKPDNFLSGGKNDFEPISKTDFVPCSTQNIYADFNFSSPVPNFNISTSVGTDFIGHDGNFSSQNNSFFGDFIPPEYPITESVSNSLLLPPCTIGLQNPFIIEKRNATPEKGGKAQGKTCSNSRSRKNFDCSKASYSDFSIVHNSSAGIFTSAAIACPTIFTTTSCQNLLPVPNQNISDPNITFSAPSFTTANIPFPALTCNGNANYHRSANPVPNSTTAAFFSSSACHSMFTTCSTTTVISSRTFASAIPPAASSSGAVITTSFSGAHFPPSTQSSLPILSLSNPIIPPSAPSTSGNSLANFNLSTIFPEINQKGNYHYP